MRHIATVPLIWSFLILTHLNVGDSPPKVPGDPAPPPLNGGLKMMVRSSTPVGDGGGSGVGGSAGFQVLLSLRGGVTFGLANLRGKSEQISDVFVLWASY